MVTNQKQSQAVFKAIADPTRRRILHLLHASELAQGTVEGGAQSNRIGRWAGGHTVGELASNFKTSRPAISKHIRLLRSAGLVTTRRQGTARICQLNAQPLRTVSQWLRDYETFWDQNLQSLKKFIEEHK